MNATKYRNLQVSLDSVRADLTAAESDHLILDGELDDLEWEQDRISDEIRNAEKNFDDLEEQIQRWKTEIQQIETDLEGESSDCVLDSRDPSQLQL